jgi:hypothetical protein
MNTIDKINSFKNLKPGWYYGYGGPLSEALANKCIELETKLRELGFQKTNAFLGEIEVLIIGYHGRYNLEVFVYENKEYDAEVVIDPDIDGVHEILSESNVSLERVLEMGRHILSLPI